MSRPFAGGCARIRRVGLLVAALGLLGFGLSASSASAARPLELGFAGYTDDLYFDPAVRDLWLNRTVAAGASTVVLGANWVDIAPSDRPAGFDPRNPNDPAYSWDSLDVGVRAATAKGLQVMILVNKAPRWAEGPDRPQNDTPLGTWKPDPEELGSFGTAIATRYSGRYVDPAAPSAGPLPPVRLWGLWAEPNLWVNLTPQFDENNNRASPEHYRRMLAAFYPAVKEVEPANTILNGGLAPYGDPPGGLRIRPLAFFRDLLCLKGRKKLKRANCTRKPMLDVLAHNPINLSGGPALSAIHPDDVSSADLKNVRRTLRAAERANTIRPRGKRPLWATEFWWNSRPPRQAGVGLQRHARWIEEALYLFWKAGASMAINLKIRDGGDPEAFVNGTGLYLANGKAKPALTAFRFPFVVDSQSKRRSRAWGKAPASGRLVIEKKKKGGWRRIERLNVDAGEVFTARLADGGKGKYRAKVGAESSLVWSPGNRSGKPFRKAAMSRVAADNPRRAERPTP